MAAYSRLDCPTFEGDLVPVHIGGLDWTKISDIRSMIQAVAEDEERGELGMHYTSVPNILKVLNPLFLDDLRQQLEDADDNKRKLLNLRNRMARIRVFDPACGSGNFLVVAYKEMRKIEAEINRRRAEADRASDIPLTNFRGIEIRSFAAEVARLALVIAQFQCDLEYRGKQLAVSRVLPLSKLNWITCGNALRLNWEDLCPPSSTRSRVSANDLFETPLDQPEIDFENEGGETFICGNPPYKGNARKNQTQKNEMSSVLSSHFKKWGLLDYVCCWIFLAARFSESRDQTNFGFVATNSVTQGQHVPYFWKHLLKRGMTIGFARTSFRWANLARNDAGVTVVVIGTTSRTNQYTLYSGEDLKSCQNISPYLVPGPSTIVEELRSPLSDSPMMQKGNYYGLSSELIGSRDEFRSLAAQGLPQSSMRRLFGASELMKGTLRFCLWYPGEAPAPRTHRLRSLIGLTVAKKKEHRPPMQYRMACLRTHISSGR